MKTITGRSFNKDLSFILFVLIFIFNGIQVNAQTLPNIPSKPEDISPLLIGENIPFIKAPDAMGTIQDLNSIIAQRSTILIFYRGGWCPYCNKQLSGLQDIEPELKKMGYQIIAISTDSPDNLKSPATKTKLEYMLLSDADLSIAKQFGIAYKAPNAYDKILPASSGGKNVDKLLPVPSVFILNKKGNIRFEYINIDIRQRISPDLLKTVAQSVSMELQ
jgi:peroxiredoxin